MHIHTYIYQSAPEEMHKESRELPFSSKAPVNQCRPQHILMQEGVVYD